MAKGQYSKALNDRKAEFAPPKDDKRQAFINELKDKITAGLTQEGVILSSAVFAHQYEQSRRRVADLEEDLGAANLNLEAVQQLMLDYFETESVEDMRVNGRLISTWIEPYASVEDNTVLQAWAIKDGLGSKLTLPWQTLNSLVKQRLEAGDSDIPGVKVFKQTKVKLGPETK